MQVSRTFSARPFLLGGFVTLAMGTSAIGWVGCAQPVDPSASNGEESTPSDNPATERVKAESGVGIKGRATEGGLISEPVSAYFKTRDRLTFAQVDQAIALFKAGGDGRGPRTHEDFMEKIIKANRLALPELPPGHRYVYDPEQEQLMVERPVE